MKVSLRARLYLLIAPLVLVILFAAWRETAMVADIEARISHVVRVDVAAVDQSRVMQVELKTQVQEWKNFLLRGHNLPAREKYLASMATSSARVGELAEQLRTVAVDPELQAQIDTFIKEHLALVRAYKTAQTQIELTEDWDYRGADIAVTGKDRAPTTLCGVIADGFAKQAQRHRVTAWEDAHRHLHEQLLGVSVALLAALLAALFFSGRLVRLVRGLVAALEAVAQGDYSPRVAAVRRDELGDLGRALNATFERLGVLHERIRTGIGGNAAALSTAASKLSKTSSDMSQSAGRSAERAQSAAAGAEEVSANVATVAASVEEMSATAKEIASQSGEASHVAREGVTVAREVGNAVMKLGVGSTQIGEIVHTIGSIAEQTNLLALNATIEAARAGDAGRGFAVVANEVKELARQSATAATDISQRVAAIQADIQAAVSGVTRLSEIVARIDQTQQSIAAAIEEQTATTAEVGRNVAEASTGNKEVAAGVAEVAAVAKQTTAGASEVRQAADELARLSAELDALVKAR